MSITCATKMFTGAESQQSLYRHLYIVIFIYRHSYYIHDCFEKKKNKKWSFHSFKETDNGHL